MTYLEDLYELWVANAAILVGIELIEDDSKLLSGEEDAQLGEELFKFQLAQDSILVLVKALSNQISQVNPFELN